MDIIDELYNLPHIECSEEEQRLNDLFSIKLQEYEEHFGDDFTTECLQMSIEEIIQNIDKCIKYNRKWDGFIVPILDYNEVDI